MPPREIDRCNHVKQKEYVPNIMRQKLDHTWNLQDYLDDKDWYEMGIDTKKKESGRAGTPGLLWELSSSGLFFLKKKLSSSGRCEMGISFYAAEPTTILHL